MKFKLAALLLGSYMLFSCGDSTRKSTQDLYNKFTHRMDSLKTVQHQLKEKQAGITDTYQNLRSQADDFGNADATVSALLREHKELLEHQEQLLDSMKFKMHAQFSKDYQNNALSAEEVQTTLDNLRARNQQIGKNLQRIAQELNRIALDQKDISTMMNSQTEKTN